MIQRWTMEQCGRCQASSRAGAAHVHSPMALNSRLAVDGRLIVKDAGCILMKTDIQAARECPQEGVRA